MCACKFSFNIISTDCSKQNLRLSTSVDIDYTVFDVFRPHPALSTVFKASSYGLLVCVSAATTIVNSNEADNIATQV